MSNTVTGLTDLSSDEIVLPIIEKKPFKILSLDGGGIKGLYTALILQHLEEAYGNPIADYFDLITGTSTGGLMALALTSKVPAAEIVNFYKADGPKIFHRQSLVKRVSGKIKQILHKGKYDNTVLKTAIENVLGTDRKMKDAHNLLCIPAFNIGCGGPIVFKYPHKEGNYHRDGNIKMVDVALATSAAPTYFPIHTIDQMQCIDGGVWLNNPVLAGICEAIDHFVVQDKIIHTGDRHIQFEEIQVLSIACINPPSGESMKSNPKRSFLQWGGALSSIGITGQMQFSDHFCKRLVNNKLGGYYHRICSPQDLSAQHCKDIDLDLATPRAIETLCFFGNRVGYDYRAAQSYLVNPFFETFKTYVTNG
ncbi:CBASS cGAMP-activated phospholipase [Cytophagaceae bacterium YF14B1]|uniref:CBASS cGAMP-activated phospholipase n=1 Tax=Xanthocytophaga flava TaxID=3048013 RepID=A0AAE3QQH5_9BACT|nr:CBASS cGAMP-activated phospholipase [Xanthocytophaga flavus]MDJ1480878.1 CBASS cGAMP-activated phospholipase [Xanthocytophaga flavus]